VAGNKVTGVVAGTCTVSANQAGNENYSPAASVTQTFQVGTGMALAGEGSGRGAFGSCTDPHAYCFDISGTGSAAGIQNGNIVGQVTYWPNSSQVQGSVTVSPPNTLGAPRTSSAFSRPMFDPTPGDKAYVSVSGTVVKGNSSAGSVQPAATPGPILPGVITGGEGQLAGATGSGTLSGLGVVGQNGDVSVDRMVMEGGLLAAIVQQFPVPTLSGWALIGLAALLAAIGMNMRRHAKW